MLIVLERLDTEECQELTLVSKLAKILNLKISLLTFHRDPNSYENFALILFIGRHRKLITEKINSMEFG